MYKGTLRPIHNFVGIIPECKINLNIFIIKINMSDQCSRNSFLTRSTLRKYRGVREKNIHFVKFCVTTRYFVKNIFLFRENAYKLSFGKKYLLILLKLFPQIVTYRVSVILVIGFRHYRRHAEKERQRDLCNV